MLELALILGGFSYLLFFLGIAGLFYKSLLIGVTIGVVITILLVFQKSILQFFSSLSRTRLSLLSKIILGLLAVQMGINFIGALGPEISFDATWYHLTLAKLYLIHHSIFFIPGGLLYYSVMPKIGEQLFSAGLAFGWESLPKIIHFLFGVTSCWVIYKISRKFLSVPFALLSVLVFYTNLVVGWESITGYIDLFRVFFEGCLLYSWIHWVSSKHIKWFYLCGIFAGFALTTKLTAGASVLVISLLSLVVFIRQKKGIVSIFWSEIVYWVIAFLIPLPWFVFSYVTTKDPFYPFFSVYFSHLEHATVSAPFLQPSHFLNAYGNFFLHASDPISPIYIAVIPLIIVLYKKFSFEEKLILFFTLFGIASWYFISGVEGTRLALPYIFSFSIIVAVVLQKLQKHAAVILSLLAFIGLTAVISIGYRAVANAKFIPVIVGRETEASFMSKNLNFSFGDFYDIDGYMGRTIHPTDMVLLYGYHNLYYVDFPFIHNSWVKKGDTFDYIATDGTPLPKRFSTFHLIYQNPITHLHVYTDNKKIWTY